VASRIVRTVAATLPFPRESLPGAFAAWAVAGAGAIIGSMARRGAVKPKMKLWVVLDGGVKFGDGRAELLERVDALGSLRQAVMGMGMSYRAAWGYLQELERAAGFKVLERHPGRGRTRLTREGRRFLDRYRRFRQGLDGVVARHFARSFRGR
jgi:molybdate transport system regulatory protein